MSEAKWTPGPWEITGSTRSLTEQSHSITIGTQSGWIAAVPASKSNAVKTRANAHLIAASPELYEALQKFLVLSIFELGDNRHKDPWKRHIERCESALAKARGEQP